MIKKDTQGITSLGQELLQESNQAYVYAVLASQARTRWKIIGDVGNSYQTQQVFRDLLKDVLAQDKLITLIQSMRTAVKDTGVRLDYCLSPGLELLPSQMIYIKNSVGYNNTLIVSSNEQNFGVNKDINSQLLKSKLKAPVSKRDNPIQDFIDRNERKRGVTPIPSTIKPPKGDEMEKKKTLTNYGIGAFEIALISFTVVVIGRFIWIKI